MVKRQCKRPVKIRAERVVGQGPRIMCPCPPEAIVLSQLRRGNSAAVQDSSWPMIGYRRILRHRAGYF